MNEPVGRRIGRFDLLEVLGSGAMGVVYRARDQRLGRYVAIKLLAEGLATDDEMVRRFGREARAASALNHPNIVTVYDAGFEDGTGYIVTELLQGSTLRDRMGGRPMASDHVLEIGRQIAAGLTAAHSAGLIHRDVKPENIFVTRDGTVKLLDFGVARVTRQPAGPGVAETQVGTIGTQTGVIVGTPSYMAPEQIRGEGADARADLFAVGCVLYEMLTGAGAFRRAHAADTMAAILNDAVPPPAPALGIPARVERIARRCLNKSPEDRFQTASDLRFALEAAAEAAPQAPGVSSQQASGGDWRTGALAVGVLALGAGLLWSLNRPSPVEPGPVVVSASTIVPSSERPIAPAISPDGHWVGYIGLFDGGSSLKVQYVTGGTPIVIARDTELPLQNRSLVGGIDIVPDGSAVTVAGRPRAMSLFQVPGIWLVPAPVGGPPRRMTERFATVRWSPDGTQVVGILANPLVGDAVAIADADGQHERVIVPAARGMHFHQPAWGHDGRYVYYSQTLDAAHDVGQIYRVPSAGGTPEPVVATSGTAMYPALTPDGKALIYAGDHDGQGLNLWWKPLDGSSSRRITTGAGEFSEPYVSRDGRHLVALARRRRGAIVRVAAGATAGGPSARVESVVEDGAEASICRAENRVFFASRRTGRRQIWSANADGTDVRPVTSGSSDDRRPSVSGDCRHVAYMSERDGRRSIAVVSAEGGTSRTVTDAELVDRVSWAPDNHRLVYSAAGPTQSNLWLVDIDGGVPTRVPAESPRVPAWSPVAEQIAFVGLIDGKPFVHVIAPDGTRVREPLSIEPVSLPTAMAWAPDGLRLGLVNLPGRARAEVWVLDTTSGALRKIAELAAPSVFEGISWTSDGRWLMLGRTEFDSEVLLLELR